MSRSAKVIKQVTDLEALASAWDALPESRGTHADLYDTYGWFSAWMAAARPEQLSRVRVATVSDGDTLEGLLPLYALTRRRWRAVGLGYRPRFRPIVRGEQPNPEVIANLIEAAARGGAAELVLPAMPSRDPAYAMLVDAFRSQGWMVSEQQGTHECLTEIQADSWPAYRRNFRKYHRTVNNFTNKAALLGPVELECFGNRPDKPLMKGFSAYLGLHEEGWKGRLRDETRRHRGHLLSWAQKRGSGRLFVLRVSGVPTAAILWFRVGGAAVAYSTVYDARFTALSVGTIAMWRAHEQIIEEQMPQIIDYLPGQGPQKSQLGKQHDPLVTLRAVRRFSISGIAQPVKRALRSYLKRGKKPRREREARERLETKAAPIAVDVDAEYLTNQERGPRADPIDQLPAVEMFLAVALGLPNRSAARELFAEGNTWYRIGGGPRAIARVRDTGNAPAQVLDLILIQGKPADAEIYLKSLSRARNQTLHTSELIVKKSPLPYPSSRPD